MVDCFYFKTSKDVKFAEESKLFNMSLYALNAISSRYIS